MTSYDDSQHRKGTHPTIDSLGLKAFKHMINERTQIYERLDKVRLG